MISGTAPGLCWTDDGAAMPKFVKGVCFYCRTEFAKPLPNQRGLKWNNATTDHLYPDKTPLPSGVTSRNDPRVRLRACLSCNQIKGHKHPLSWLGRCPSAEGAADLAKLLAELGEPQVTIDAMLLRQKRIH